MNSSISQGNFDYRPAIRNEDELGELAEAFSMMAVRLKKLEETYLDASPLTPVCRGGWPLKTSSNKRSSSTSSIQIH